MADSKNTQQPTQFNVLLIGDSCIDKYAYGSCDRLSPEAPIPVLKFSNTLTKKGMAANVKDNLEAFGLVVDFITNEEEITKTRYIDERSGQHLLRVDHDVALRPWDGKTLLPLETYDAIVISDYNKGFLTYELIENLRKSYKGPVFLDTKKQDLSRFDKCFVKINETEYNARFSICPELIVTLGGKGAMYKRFFNERFFPTIKTEVVDVCGAGDTFLSALAYEYLRSSNMDNAINFANRCSAITVTHRGVYVLTNTDIDSIVS